jgi:hypothetical protein
MSHFLEEQMSRCLRRRSRGWMGATLAATMAVSAAGVAKANDITVDVSAAFTAFSFEPACSAPGCEVMGSFVFDGATGQVISADLTPSGFNPSAGSSTVGLFDVIAHGPSIDNNETEVTFDDSSGSALFLFLNTPTLGSLIGLASGALEPSTSVADGGDGWPLNSGSVSVPEPESGLQLVIALAAIAWAGRKRVRRRWAWIRRG